MAISLCFYNKPGDEFAGKNDLQAGSKKDEIFSSRGTRFAWREKGYEIAMRCSPKHLNRPNEVAADDESLVGELDE